MTKKRKIIFIVLSIIILLIFVVCIKVYFFFNAKPNIKVNYVAEWNRISKPANYDPCQNAYFDYAKATNCVVKEPEEFSRPNWPDWPGDMNDRQLKIVKDLVSNNAKSLEYYIEGSKKPYYWAQSTIEKTETWNVIYPSLADYRLLSQALCWRAKLNAFEGKIEAAFEEITACYRVGYQLSESKLFLDQLMGQGILSISIDAIFEILSNTKPQSQQLVNLQSRLNEQLKNKCLLDFTSDKFYINDIIQHIFTDDGRGNGHLIPKEAQKLWEELHIIRPQRRSFGDFIEELFSNQTNRRPKETRPFLQRAITGPYRKQTAEKFNEIFKKLDEWQRMTPWQLHKKGIVPGNQLKDIIKDDWLIIDNIGFLAYSPIENLKISEAEQSAVITTIVILRFKADKGYFPDNLDAIIKEGYLKELPQDPYNNGPFIYKKTGDDFILYSPGLNLTDEGGKIGRYNYSGIVRSSTDGDAVFWPIKNK